jgi:lipoprotein-releasing system permease protein
MDTSSMTQDQVNRLIGDIELRPGVVGVEPMVEATALASAHGRGEGVQVRGVRPEDLQANELVVEGMKSYSEQRGVNVGTLEGFGAEEALSRDIIVGAALANAMGLIVGDRIELTQPNGASSVAGRVGRTKAFFVSGIFHVGNERYDRYTMFIPIEAAKSFFGHDDGYPGLGIRIADANKATEAGRQLMVAGMPYAQSWQDRHGTYVTALIVERNVMRLILFIVVIITSLNIIIGVLMLVKNKARDVAILRTIGATKGSVVRIFLMTGTILGMTGVLVGVVVGVLCVLFIAPIQHFLEALFGFELFPADIYQLDSLPAQLQWSEVFIVSFGAFLVTLVMSIIPSMWAARLNPVEALRFE